MKKYLTAAFVAISGVLCAGMALAAVDADDLMTVDVSIAEEVALLDISFDPVSDLAGVDEVATVPVPHMDRMVPAHDVAHRLLPGSMSIASSSSFVGHVSTVPIPLRI